MNLDNVEMVLRSFELNRSSSMTADYLAPKIGIPVSDVYEACRKLSDQKKLLFLHSGSEPHSACYAHPDFRRPVVE